MRAIVLMLGAVVPLVLLGCVGAENETGADDQEEPAGEAAARESIVPPQPHGRLFAALGALGALGTPAGAARAAPKSAKRPCAKEPCDGGRAR